jgi:ABC-type branched-subunit amino acid transport system permease subunit
MAFSARPAANERNHPMLRQRFFIIEALTAVGLIAAPFVLPHLGFSPTTMNRILVWGLFGIGFDILFGFTGLLSFGQSALFGTGGFVAAYLLTRMDFSSVIGALIIGTIAATVVGFFVGLIALRRTGIYFAMITVAIAEVFYSSSSIRSRNTPAARTVCPVFQRRASISALRPSSSIATGLSTCSWRFGTSWGS